ncbi:hypothetical protein QAD02_003152 [Eretmocerus hayati]|uniref:Uncharacterized protein n=1 Tax=Eretmocerus hayati TaxID=131215 RepID=A0ACC2NLY7_9HYME|nr:hypothetical protein QAD02_003152 [Eretmocerus hayati]
MRRPGTRSVRSPTYIRKERSSTKRKMGHNSEGRSTYDTAVKTPYRYGDLSAMIQQEHTTTAVRTVTLQAFLQDMFFDDANRSEVVNRVAIGGHIITNGIQAFASDGSHNAVVRHAVQAIPGDTVSILTVTVGIEELTPKLRENLESPHNYATRRTEQVTGRETQEVPDDKVQRVLRGCIKELEVEAETQVTEKQERSHNIVPYSEFEIKR